MEVGNCSLQASDAVRSMRYFLFRRSWKLEVVRCSFFSNADGRELREDEALCVISSLALCADLLTRSKLSNSEVLMRSRKT